MAPRGLDPNRRRVLVLERPARGGKTLTWHVEAPDIHLDEATGLPLSAAQEQEQIDLYIERWLAHTNGGSKRNPWKLASVTDAFPHESDPEFIAAGRAQAADEIVMLLRAALAGPDDNDEIVRKLREVTGLA